jgi:two-component system chemotaxis sensor kinase CheA
MTSQTEEHQEADLDLSAYKPLFLEQASAYLTTLRRSLIQLRDDPANRRSLREAHRATHTLKGMASTMHYESLAALARRLESPFLSELPLTADQISTLLVGCDEFGKDLERLDKEDDG